jgi:predicted P-loop ATPase
MSAGRVLTAITLLKQTSILYLAQLLGLTVRERDGVTSAGEFARCPACGAQFRNGGRRGERRLAVGLRGDGRGWRCHGRDEHGGWCGASGDSNTLACLVLAGVMQWRLMSPDVKVSVADRVIALLGSPSTNPPLITKARAEPEYPDRNAVSKLWDDALAADLDSGVAQWLHGRGLDPRDVARKKLAKVIALNAALPKWARFGSRPWNESGHRVVFELIDAAGDVRSVLARTIQPNARLKSLAPRGKRRSGLVLANAPARAMLRDAGVTNKPPIIITEGEIDFLTWDAVAGDRAIFGIFNGSWSDVWANRLAAVGTDITIATDRDKAGDKYAEDIAAGAGRAGAASRLTRWPAEADRLTAAGHQVSATDANEFLVAGVKLVPRGDPYPPPSAITTARAMVLTSNQIPAPAKALRLVVGDRAESDATRPTSAPTPASGGTGGPTDPPDWRQRLSRNRFGAVRSTPHNLALVLNNDPAWVGVIAFDERLGAAVFISRPPFGAEWAPPMGSLPTPVTDVDTTNVGVVIEREHGITFAHDTLCRVIETIAMQHKFDAVREWMSTLTWDGVPRLNDWLTTYVGVRPSRLSQACGPRWIISIVARTFEPGAKVDHILVVVGPQGEGKSNLLAALVGGHWFSDQLAPLNSKDASVGLAGYLVIELSELEALKRADLALIKAFLSRRFDSYRPPYGRRNIHVPRRVVFAASTNEGAFLRDPTGARRFWTFRVAETGPIDSEAIARDRDQLFAEAVHRYRAGEKWWLHERDLRTVAEDAVEEHQQVDPWEPEIEAFLATVKPGFVTIAELHEVLEIEVPRRDQVAANRVAAILRDRLHWQPHQKRLPTPPGTRVRGYIPPAPPAWSAPAIVPPTAPSGSVTGVTGTETQHGAGSELGSDRAPTDPFPTGGGRHDDEA